jgi:uncharacterized SAM-binding protein YcdF (DUF218 family)
LRKTLDQLVRRIARLAAAAFALQVLGGLLGPPAALVGWLTARNEPIRHSPQYVVVLGGAGIPSETGLIRTYYAAECGKNLTNAVLVVALPADGDPEISSVGRMRDELVMRGISRSRIRMETRGLNTHEQAVNIALLLGPEALAAPVLVVTSPSHIRRALLCFRKAGFRQIGALAAEDADNEADAGPHTRARYSFWSALQFEVQMARELTAMAVYKIRGWI